MTEAEKINRIKKIKETLEEKKEKKQRLSGEMEANKKRLLELHKDCKEKYGIEVKDLADNIKKLEEECIQLIEEAEEKLQINI